MFAKYEYGVPEVLEPDKCHEWKWVKLSDIPKPQFRPLESLLATGFDDESILSYFK